MLIATTASILCLALLSTAPMYAQIAATPGSSQNLVAYCFDIETGAVIPNCGVQLYNGYYQYTGGHNHEDNRPQTGTWKAWGTVSPASGWYPGYVGLPVTYTASRIGQWEWIDVCAAYCSTTDVQVAYNDLVAYFPNNHAVLIGDRPAHPSNHWATSFLNSAINNVTQAYYDEFSSCSGYDEVGVNDMALPFGGLFDHKSTWQPPHYTHDRGRSVDIRCRPGVQNSVIHHPISYNRFIELCIENGLTYAIRESAGTENEHIHCSTSSSGN